VQDFSVFLANGEDSRSYTVADNVGDSVTNSLASVGAFGAATFSLPDSRLTKVTITSANTNGWNFAIDNVTFTPAAASPVPEPESMLLMSAGLLVVIAVRRR
jgi:hypothetical protein